MPYKKYNSANNAFATLATPLADTDVTMVLQGKYGRFPTSNFIVKITKTVSGVVTARENVYVTTRSGATCTGLTRAYEPVPVDDAATSNIQQALNFAALDLVEVVPSTEFLKDMQDAISGKVDTVAGLRTGFGTDKHVRINRTSGAEESVAVATGTAAISTDKIRVEKAGGTYEDVPYSAILADMQAGNAAKGLAGEALSIRDSVFLESFSTFALATAQQPISYSALTTRVELPIFGSGVAASTFKLALKKTGTPAQNLNVRIETDNAGLASGTLFHANGTSAITAASLTTSFADTTITLAGSITVPYGTKVWIVLYSGTYGSESLSTTNYYSVGVKGNAESGNIFKPFRWNGSTHTGTPVTQTATWTGETSVGVFTNALTNFTCTSPMRISSVVKSSNTTTSGTNLCIITQGSNTATASFGVGHTATFTPNITLVPGAFSIQFTYSGNSNCYESTANSVASDMLFVTSLSVVVRDLRQIVANEVMATPYISGTGITPSVLTKTTSDLGYKLGFVPRICTGTFAQGVDASTVFGGAIDYPGLTEGGIYFVSTAGTISTTVGTVKMPIGIAASGKLNVGRFNTGMTQQLSLGASVTSAPFYHHGGAVTIINTGGTVQTQTSPDNITWTNFFNVTTLHTISLNIPQGYVRGITSAGGACTFYN